MHRLRILHEFARRGTVTNTAAALHLTPSAVSQQLSVLQREIGQVLLEPVGRRVHLTDTGRVLARHAARIVAAEERAWIALEQEQTVLSADLSVGVLATVAASLVPRTVSILTERHPQITVRTHEVTPEEAVPAVRNGDLDMAFILDYPDVPTPGVLNLNAAVIAVEDLKLVAPSDHEWFDHDPVGLVETADLDWVASGGHTEFGTALITVCRRAGFEPRIVHHVDEQATAMAMVAGNLGITLAADLALRALRPNGVDVHQLIQPFVRRVLLLSRHTARPSEAAFVDAAISAAHDLLPLR